MVLGQKLWEGIGKSGASFIKSITMEGVTSIYTWTAQLKGFGCAEGIDCNLNVTGNSTTPPKGLGATKDQGILMTQMGEMAVVKGFDLMKMMADKPTAVGLWGFMTMSDNLKWLNDTIAIVVFEALDPMWGQVKVTIHEWTV